MAASGTRYVPVSETDMRALLEGEMGFEQIQLPGTRELVFQRQVEGRSGRQWPYAVRVYSSVVSGETRDCGEDAIRVVLVDLESGKARKVLGEGKGKAGRRIYRTKSAMTNLRARCRDYFRHVMANECPKCGGLMAVRTGKNGAFLGCLKYPECNGTKDIES